jgi:hypothetical protein
MRGVVGWLSELVLDPGSTWMLRECARARVDPDQPPSFRGLGTVGVTGCTPVGSRRPMRSLWLDLAERCGAQVSPRSVPQRRRLMFLPRR